MVSPAEQPVGKIFQVAYVERDMEEAIGRFVTTLGIGPWFVGKRPKTAVVRYRGTETPNLDLSIAWAYSGMLQYEIVVQHDDGPSVFREVVEERGYGPHHYASMTKNFDTDFARLLKLGHNPAYEGKMGEGPGSIRVAYMDTRKALGGMMYELAEYSEPMAQMFRSYQLASVDWDGTDPIRQAGPPPHPQAKP
jgi:Glyoxalase/Bleomycin resistance protein/Dioxygenase superfamily